MDTLSLDPVLSGSAFALWSTQHSSNLSFTWQHFKYLERASCHPIPYLTPPPLKRLSSPGQRSFSFQLLFLWPSFQFLFQLLSSGGISALSTSAKTTLTIGTALVPWDVMHPSRRWWGLPWPSLHMPLLGFSALRRSFAKWWTEGWDFSCLGLPHMRQVHTCLTLSSLQFWSIFYSWAELPSFPNNNVCKQRKAGD